MIPVVTVVPNPRGLPIAITHSPILSESEFPIRTSLIESCVSIFKRAKSVRASVPIILASYFFSLCKTIYISSSFLTT